MSLRNCVHTVRILETPLRHPGHLLIIRLEREDGVRHQIGLGRPKDRKDQSLCMVATQGSGAPFRESKVRQAKGVVRLKGQKVNEE